MVGAKWHLSSPAPAGSCDWKYPKTLELLEGDNVELPINLGPGESKLDPRWFSLIRSVNNVIIEDMFKKVKLTAVGNMGHSFTCQLQQGTYDLDFVSGHTEINIKINVGVGKVWNASDKFILKEDCLQENLACNKVLRFTSAECKESNSVSVLLNDC